MGTREITVIGGGLAGLLASIAAAEGGGSVTLHEVHSTLGGRARSTTGRHIANFGPHALYADGPLYAWLDERHLLPPLAKPRSTGLRFRRGGRLRRTPPLAALKALRLGAGDVPHDVDLRTWATAEAGQDVADALAKLAGVFTFDHDPGRLSAAFVMQRARRAFHLPAAARFPIGGWSSLIDVLATRARDLGVDLVLDSPVDALPEPPVIVATDLRAARRLLGDDSLRWTGSRTMLIDIGLSARRGDPWIVSDLDAPGWVERYSAQDPTLAPAGQSLIQAQAGVRPEEDLPAAEIRLERLLDDSFEGWRDRTTWHRRQLVTDASGALDLPGTTWRDRPAVDQGDGVFLAGDMVRAPGLLAEVSWASAVEAATLALGRVPLPA